MGAVDTLSDEQHEVLSRSFCRFGSLRAALPDSGRACWAQRCKRSVWWIARFVEFLRKLQQATDRPVLLEVASRQHAADAAHEAVARRCGRRAADGRARRP